MSKKIKFTAIDRHSYEVCPRPTPSTASIPKWWKDASPYIVSNKNPDGNKLIVENGESNASFKKCTPMLDSLGLGYTIPLWADVQVRTENGSPVITWRTGKDVFQIHYGNGVEYPEGYGDFQFKFMNQWVPSLPKGHSLLVTHPIGYQKSPFRALSGVIDYDKTNHPLYPIMLLKNGFEGIIEKGTPMVQVFPFKRDNWESSFDYFEYGDFDINIDRDIKATIVNNYVKNMWSKKSFK